MIDILVNVKNKYEYYQLLKHIDDVGKPILLLEKVLNKKEVLQIVEPVVEPIDVDKIKQINNIILKSFVKNNIIVLPNFTNCEEAKRFLI